ncbi:MAG: cupin domain-containing protein [Caulobacter sp.]|nr:cupin domain-containing protein [Caulobacter sp.]
MTKTTSNMPVRMAFAATILGVGALFGSAASAATCPAAQTMAGARTTGEMAPKDVTDMELAFVDLAKEIDGLDGRRLRIRRLVVQPGGVVPWHSHGDRPALIMTLEGSITEYRSDCGVPIEHPAGDVARESGGISHWWRNNGTVPAVLISADIKNDGPASDDAM